ncbi:hypothetical protein BKA83DRAFT_4072491, partial [Pisolithus microcarpus]
MTSQRLINRDGSVELQQAIESICSWYHRSALTNAYLFDFSGIAALANGVWFSRGWTFQELLAPPTSVFCMQDWLFALHSQAKRQRADPAMLAEVQKASGVPVRHPKHFCPGSAGLDRALS